MEYIFKIEKENKKKDNEEEIIKEENKEEKKEEKEIEITNNVQTSQEIQNNNYEILNDSEIIKDSNFIDIYKINEKIKEYDKLYPRRTKKKEKMEELLDLINSPLNFKNNKKKSHHFNFRSFSNKKSLHPNLNKSNEKYDEILDEIKIIGYDNEKRRENIENYKCYKPIKTNNQINNFYKGFHSKELSDFNQKDFTNLFRSLQLKTNNYSTSDWMKRNKKLNKNEFFYDKQNQIENLINITKNKKIMDFSKLKQKNNNLNLKNFYKNEIDKFSHKLKIK